MFAKESKENRKINSDLRGNKIWTKNMRPASKHIDLQKGNDLL